MIDMVASLANAVTLPIDLTTKHVLINEDTAGALILAETKPLQYTS